jgi:hypothetical protein
VGASSGVWAMLPPAEKTVVMHTSSARRSYATTICCGKCLDIRGSRQRGDAYR